MLCIFKENMQTWTETIKLTDKKFSKNYKMLHKNCNNAKNSTTFSNYIRNIPIEDDEIMVLFDFTKFLDLANLALTITWYTFNSTSKLMMLQWEDQPLQPKQKFICRFMNILQYLQHYTLHRFGNDLLMAFIPYINEHTWIFFCITSTIFIKY